MSLFAPLCYDHQLDSSISLHEVKPHSDFKIEYRQLNEAQNQASHSQTAFAKKYQIKVRKGEDQDTDKERVYSLAVILKELNSELKNEEFSNTLQKYML